MNIFMPKNKEGQRSVLIPNDWAGRFLFAAGAIRPARGLEDILYALNHLSNKSSNIPALVIAGETTSRMTKYRKTLEDWIRAHKLSSKICWAGKLNEDEISWCYQNCQAFIMSSRIEACPNIALEAMSHGCISISANNPPLPEIFDGAAIYYQPKDGRSLAEVIQTVFDWNDNQLREASERARKQASKFSWDICAERTVAELLKAVNNFK